MDINAHAMAVIDRLKNSTVLADWCAARYSRRCILQYGEDAMDLLTQEDAPWIVVCPTETSERRDNHDTVSMVAIAVGIVNSGKSLDSAALDLRVYDGEAEVIEFARLVHGEAEGADFGCSYTKTEDTEFLTLNKFPLFLGLTGLILVEPEIVQRANMWRQTA